MNTVTKATLTGVYQRLLKAFGPQKWWPAQTRFEVIVGAILTQNTNWGNVEKALRNLKDKQLLTPPGIRSLSSKELASLIRPAGYFNIKTKRLKNFISFFFDGYKGNLGRMMKEEMPSLRRKLLSVNGIGPETADSILLYALDKPVFVVDAYTKRLLYRHNMISSDADYHVVQEMFMKLLDHDVPMFNEYHGLIVRLGKDYCKTKPLCRECPLKDFHYSLVFRCSQCHRVLPDKKDRVSIREGYRCRMCRVK